MSPAATPIAFIDLAAQRRRLGARLDQAMLRVVDHGQYIMGPEVRTLERQLAAFTGARHVVTCANGTDALTLVLMAWGIGPGDAVLVPSFTFVATAEAPALLGATPVFCDVEPDRFTLSPESLERGIAAARALGLTPRVVIPVDLFGQPADYRRLAPIAAAHGLRVLADAAQGLGATLDGRAVGTLADATATSFFPAKPLGCYGDGGAVFTEDDALAETLGSLRLHGKGSHKYDNARIGVNSRLDTLQAAILIEKLSLFGEELAARAAVAGRYTAGLAGVATVPAVVAGATSAWAQYTLRLPDRARVAAALQAEGIPTAIYYPVPLHRQPAYQAFPADPAGLAVSDRLAGEVLSLPMHPYLDPVTQDRIINAVLRVATTS